jgi:hypothetical protein
VAFFIAYVSGRSGRGRASSRKRASLDEDQFETYEAAEEVARARWPEGGYFIIEARDARSAEARAIEDSVRLDDMSS